MQWLEGMAPENASASMTQFEQSAFQAGFRRIAGVDEVGRGPLAGPLVAAAVVLGEPVEGLNDSKLLSASRRADLYSILQQGPHCIAVAVVEAAEVDMLGIQPANYAAMNRALPMCCRARGVISSRVKAFRKSCRATRSLFPLMHATGMAPRRTG